MKHDVPDWVMGLINALPILLVVGIWVYYLVRFKRGQGAKITKERSFKRMALTFLLWIVAALVIVAVFNLMQDARR